MAADNVAKGNESRQKEMRDSGKHAPLNLFTSHKAFKLLKVITRNIRKRCGICLKLTIKKPERRH